MKALADLMRRTDQVQITGPGTDLRFSIKGIGAKECGGQYNIPDGEVFSCPVRDSVEGVVQYNAPTVYLGSSFDNIRLVFKKGRIVEATSNNTKRLNEILDSDPGARYIGEFAIGFNPHILEPMRDILFDEKIAGSFHFTPGQAYEDCGNGNKSQVHWDMVCIQRPEYGGGEIRFDGKLIRKDGLFVPKALHKLNPEYLLGAAAGSGAAPVELDHIDEYGFVDAMERCSRTLGLHPGAPEDRDPPAHRGGAALRRAAEDPGPRGYPADPEFRRRSYRYPTFPDFRADAAATRSPGTRAPERYHEAARVIFAGYVRENVRYVETSFHLHVTEFIHVPGKEIIAAIRSAAPPGLEVRVFAGMLRRRLRRARCARRSTTLRTGTTWPGSTSTASRRCRPSPGPSRSGSGSRRPAR
jgi:hypothetical protein